MITQARRNIALDVIKGICIILMVIGHSGAPKGLMAMIYSFHMPIFFIISGFLLKEKYINDLWGGVRSKIKSIWWPYAFWSAVFIFLHNIFTHIGFFTNYYSFKEIGIRLIRSTAMFETEQLLGGFWFLTALIFSSVLVLIYYRICGMSRLSIIVGIVACLGFSLLYKAKILPWLPYFDSVNFLSAAFFMTGTLLARENFHLIATRKPLVLVACGALAIGTFWIHGSMQGVTVITLFPYYITASLISWGLIVIFWKVPETRVVKYLALIGGRTLDILIFHFIALRIVTWIRVLIHESSSDKLTHFPVIDTAAAINNPTDFHWIIYFIIGLGLALLLSYLKDCANTGINRLHRLVPKRLIP